MKYFTGVSYDSRTTEEKNKDWLEEELLGSALAPYQWKDFNELEIPQYTIRNQNGSGECGAFSTVKALGINNKPFKNLRPEFIYTKRSNPTAGMYMQEMFDIACKYGAPEDVELKGDGLTEEQANAYKPTEEETAGALKYRGKNYVFMNPKDIDAVARAVDSGYTPILLLRCDISEWTTEPFVDNRFTPPFNVNHFNPVIYAGMRNGIKTLVTDDSWGSSYGKNGHRFVSEDFITKRVEQIGYIIDLPEVVINKPSLRFTKPLSFGQKDPAVKTLQEMLAHEGFFPATTTTTDFFGSITAGALKKWQVAHGILDFQNEKDIRRVRFGQKSIDMANSLYK